MTCVQKQFLYCMKAFMEGTAPNICITEDPADGQALFVLATQQMALPMVYGTTHALPGFQAQPEEFRQEVRRQTMGQTAAQIRRTQAFAAVYQELLIQGIRPVVVKGLVCRELYPTPEQRISGDEDLLLDPESFCCCVELLKQRGMELVSGRETRAFIWNCIRIAPQSRTLATGVWNASLNGRPTGPFHCSVRG